MTPRRTAVQGAAAALAVALALAGAGLAQTIWEPLRPAEPTRQQGPELASGSRVTLRALDKVSGAVADLSLEPGARVSYGRLGVEMLACRFPADNPASDAYAFLDIADTQTGERLFHGWMIASSPALSALDHPRYDIWVLRCE